MSSASMIPVAALAGLERAVNAVIALDPETRRRLSRLEGRVIAIELQGTGLSLFAAPGKGGLRLMGHYDSTPDTTLRGTPLALMRMGAGGTTEGLFAGDVQIDGDVEVGQRFKHILDTMEIDWEEHLSRLTGDIVAHQVGNVFRSLAAWRRTASDTLARDTGEYIQEELQMVPGRREVDHFMDQVDTIRTDVDRLEARIRRIQGESP
ncbi:ubiquinone biosynthesis accessory factor UbiJ [Thiohalomonas denitrificans]|uniref:Ubiquinone biosynthesis accessory factor UbiJ n=1 Tax=Thiohalomonas denitrificans TaxID=415747 RepID=A0A1G5QV97_9GAMM|nr:SCP2 sterol-binding domain-containing protein [Thiohalomonas denitrificans]SCZ65029.1 ubiquinone biosynthesis protein UbiJ [Thiohalomonas denitrificans]